MEILRPRGDAFGNTTQHGGGDIYVLRTNATGDVLSGKLYGGSGADLPGCAIVDPKRDIMLSALAGANDGDFANIPGGSAANLVLLKIKADGSLTLLKSWPLVLMAHTILLSFM